MDIQQEKKALRRRIKERNATISDRERILKSEKIFRRTEELKQFRDADYVMVFWSFEDEVFTHDFILKWYRHKHILLPVIRGEDLEVIKYTGPDKMVRKEPYFIPEPAGETIDTALIQLVIVPGLAFDKNNNRLGRGKAFYDRFLDQINAFSLGVCFDFQLFDSIPISDSDVKMDLVISE